MSASFGDPKTCPCHENSLSQLLHAIKKKLQDITLDEKAVITMTMSEVDLLEREALEVLRLVRSIKNSLAPINRIPLEVLSSIPDYCSEDTADRVSISLTHVCHGWRDMFVSRSSLWTRFNFNNLEKTRTYIERFKVSPLSIDLHGETIPRRKFLPIIPHIHRLRSLTVHTDVLPSVLKHFRCNTPLLEKLDVEIYSPDQPDLDGALFNGDLSSLYELRLHRVTTHLPWKNLANLRVVDLNLENRSFGTTQMLDFFEAAPLLHTVLLRNIVPDSSDAPHQRMVYLHHLKVFSIHTTFLPNLLHHVHIPTGASLITRFYHYGQESPVLDYLQERSPNFSNLTHITTINLFFTLEWKRIHLRGPNGHLTMLALWRVPDLYPLDRKILVPLDHPMLSTIQRLVISKYTYPISAAAEECPVFQMLSSAKNLQTLVLNDCANLPFILALDPERHPSKLVLCPTMEKLVLYIRIHENFHFDDLTSMAKNRASRGAKLSSIMMVSPRRHTPGGVSELMEHVTHLERRRGKPRPAWGGDLDESGGENE